MAPLSQLPALAVCPPLAFQTVLVSTRKAKGPWAGVDVGARNKGFHVAILDQHGYVCGPQRFATGRDVIAWLAAHDPSLVAVDSPRRPAPAGNKSRPEEKQIAREVCGIRYTPDRKSLEGGSDYYAWILNGFSLYRSLRQARGAGRPIECFPTATWTRLGGPRGGKPRGTWSAGILAGLGLKGLRSRMNQDERDAVAAAYTAYLADEGMCEEFGDLIVPRPRK